MNPNQIKQLEKLQKIFNTESVLTPEDIAQVVDGIAKVLKSYRDETRTTNSETKEVVSSFIDNVSEEVDRLRDLVKNSSQTSKYETTDAISSLQRSIKSLIQQMEVDTLSELELIRKEIPEKETPDSILLKLSSSKKKLPLSMVEGSESLLNKSQFETAIIEIGGKLTVLEKRNSKGYGELGGGSEGTGSLFLTRLRDVDITGLTKNADGKYNLGSGGGGGVTAFTQLTDVPNSYVAQANKGVRVNAAATGLEFFTLGGGTGTVTSVSVVTANGLSGSVTTATTTPAITLDISALDASKIANGLVSNAEFQFLDGVTSSIQTQLNAKQATGNYITGLTGDVTASGPGSVAATLATVNASVGSFTNANITVDAKGRITAATNGTGGGGGSGEATIFTVNQTAHGLAVGNVVRSNGTAGQFTKAQADSAANAEAVGIVTVVTDANNYTVTTGGYITTGVPVQAASTVMFLSATTAGLLTATEPSTVGQVSLPLLVVITSGTKAYFNVKRGLVIATAGSGTVGPGTINQIAYFDTTTSIASLATATYPSLTELSYGKGVTSGIQTQLNGKQGTITLTTTGTSGASTLVGNTLNIPQYSGGGGAGMAIGGSITSATAGSVLFAGVGGILQQDNASLFFNDTTNHLGIGTTTPLAALGVQKAITGTAIQAIQEPSGSNINSNNIQSGFSFSVSTRSVVSRLGRYWYTGNTANFVVSIFTETGTVLATGTVLNSATTEANGYKYVSITPITLTADQVYIIGIDETTGQNHADEWLPVVVSPLIDIKNSMYGFGTYPNTIQNPNKSYSAPNMTIAPEFESQISSGYDANNRFETFTDQFGNTAFVSNPYGMSFGFNSPVGVGIGVPRTGKVFEVLGESYFSGQRPIQARGAAGDVISFGVGSTNVPEAAISATNGYLIIDSSTANDMILNYYKSNRNVNITGIFGSAYKFAIGVDSASKIGQMIRGATSQTGDLFQGQDIAGSVLARVKANGDIETTGSIKVGPDSGKGVISYATNNIILNPSGNSNITFDNIGMYLGQPGQSFGQTISLKNQGSGTNYNAGDLTLITGIGTGSGTAGSFIWQTADVTTSGSSAQAVTTKMTLLGNGRLKLQNSAAASLGTVGGTIFNSFTDASTTSTNGTEDDLYTYTTVANTLAINGDSIAQREHVSFISSATAARRIKKYFAGTLIYDSGAVTLTLGGEFVIETTVIRESSTVVRCTVNVVTTSASSVPYAVYTRITALTLTGTNILKTTGIASGTGAASGDIINKLSKVILEPAA